MKPPRRIQQNLLATNERRLLTWLAGRMPPAVTPDRLTTIGFLGAVMVGAGYALSSVATGWLLLSIAGYCVNWFGDSLDGSLARFRKIERPTFGYFIDHSTDALGNLVIMAGLAASPFVETAVAMFGLAAYLLLSVHTFIAARVIDEFRLSYLNGGPTELRLFLIALTTAMLIHGPAPLPGSHFSAFDAIIAVLGSVMTLLFVIQTATTSRKLLRPADPAE